MVRNGAQCVRNGNTREVWQLYVVGWLYGAGWHVVAKQLCMVGRRGRTGGCTWPDGASWPISCTYVDGQRVVDERLHMAR